MSYRNVRLLALTVIALLVVPFVAFAQETPSVPARIQRLMDEGFNQGNINVVDELFADNYIVHPSGGNRDAFKESTASLRGMFPDVHAEASQIVTQGNWASFHFTMTGTFANAYVTSQGSLPPTGQFTTLTMNVFLRYDDQGKVVEEWDYIDNYGFLEQIGVLQAMNTSYTTPAIATAKPTTSAKIEASSAPLNETSNNKASVQRIFDEMLNLRDTSVSNELFAQDFAYHGVQGSMNLSTWQGSVSGLLAAMPDLQVTPEVMLAEGNLVAVKYTLRGTFLNPLPSVTGEVTTPNGQYVELPGSMILRFDDSGRIVETTEIFDNLSLLTQLGVFHW